MSFLEAIKSCLRNSFNYSGRARPSEYWWTILAFLTFTLLLGQLGRIQVFALLVGWVWLAALVPIIALTVRRLHDTDRSGAWFLIAFIPLVGGVLLLVYTAMDSTPGVNRYGDSPKYPSRPEESVPGYTSRTLAPGGPTRALNPIPLPASPSRIPPRPAKLPTQTPSYQLAWSSNSDALGNSDALDFIRRLNDAAAAQDATDEVPPTRTA